LVTIAAARFIAGTDHGGDAEFAGDDRGVASAATAIGNDRGRAFHHRLPIRIGHVGDQHVALFHAVHLGGRLDQSHLPLPDLLPDRATAREHGGFLVEPVAPQAIGVAARLHGLGACLQDIDLAVFSVAAPLDVHRPLVMLFDRERVASELLGFRVADREAAPVLRRDVDGFHGLARATAVVVDHARGLGAQRLGQNRRATGEEIGLVEIDLVGIHRALDDGLAKPVGRVDEHDLIEAGFGVEREHHARRAGVAANHALHAGGERDVRMRIALVDAVGDRTVVVERCEYLSYRMKNILYTIDI
jgi:hypothetical protein